MALAGDEPHYLAISQSLARDGDLNVFNQYFRGGFKEFLDVKTLPAHGTWGKGFKKIYSYHLPGVAFTVAPFFFFKLSPPLLYFLVRSFLGLFGALLAVLVYLFGLRLWRSRSLALFATFVFTLGAPVFFYSFHLFPEVQAMLLVLGALYILLYKCREHGGRCLWAGLLLGSAMFWGVKYALFIYPFTLGFCAYWLWRRKYRQALLLLVFPLLFQALFFYYLHAAYGSFSPNAVYYGMLNPEQSQALYRHPAEEDPAAGALGDPARLFLRPARRPAAVQSALLLRLPRPAAGAEEFQALPPAPAGRPAGAAVHPQPRLLHHPRRLLPPGALPGPGRLGAAAVRRGLLPGKPRPPFPQGVPRAAPLPALRFRLPGVGAVHPLPAHHPRLRRCARA